MARAGIASRRACEEIIQAGRVQVNGQVVTEMGVKVDPRRDKIAVDGQALSFEERPRHSYWMIYKPVGVLSVFDDERGRPGLEKLISAEERLFTVGRLDLDSEGLMLLTNNGELAQVLSHPSHAKSKTYLVLVDRRPGVEALQRLQRGVELDGERTAPSSWVVMEEPPKVHPLATETALEGVWLKVTLREGRKRQIRRMAAVVGLEVRRLIRIRIGTLSLDRKLLPGQSRRLTRAEVQSLLALVDRAGRRQPGRRRAPVGRSGRPPRPGAAAAPKARRPGDREVGRDQPASRGGPATPKAGRRPPGQAGREPTRPAAKPVTRPAAPKPGAPKPRASKPRAPKPAPQSGQPKPAAKTPRRQK